MTEVPEQFATQLAQLEAVNLETVKSILDWRVKNQEQEVWLTRFDETAALAGSVAQHYGPEGILIMWALAVQKLADAEPV